MRFFASDKPGSGQSRRMTSDETITLRVTVIG